ncbi:MAG: DUF2877 domain-containing protein [Oscillospiraceae bacterium]|nr:DUF2877 domain-containing protein [Oscillospiraceae bacterium]
MTVFQDNIRLPSDIFSFLQKNSSGEVLLTTSKGIYLQFSSSIFLLMDRSYGLTPIGIGLSRFVDFATAIAPKAGQHVSVFDGCIHFPGGTLNPLWDVVDTEIFFATPLQQQVDRCAKLLVSRCSQRSLAALAAPLLLNQPLSSAAHNNPYCTHALPILEQLLDAMKNQNSSNINEAVSQLLGFGIGLTPSLDDILLGMLYGLLRLAAQEGTAAILGDAIKANAPTRTNAISAAYLDAVACGGCFQRLDDILKNLSSSTPINIEPILEIGSSSGSEMLLGLLLAIKITTKG